MRRLCICLEIPDKCGVALKSLLVLLVSLCAAVAIFIGGVAVASYVISDPEPHRFANMDTPDLWTSHPVVVDTSDQTYERIAALPTVAAIPASLAAVGDFSRQDADGQQTAAAQEALPGVDQAATGSVETEVGTLDNAELGHASLDPQHADWCFARYRSYRLEDDSYQPYGRGQRQPCVSPWTTMPADMQISTGQASTSHAPEEQALVEMGGEGMLVQGDEAHADPVEISAAASPQGAMPSREVTPVDAHEAWCSARYRSYRVYDNSYQPFDGGMRRTCSSPHG